MTALTPTVANTYARIVESERIPPDVLRAPYDLRTSHLRRKCCRNDRCGRCANCINHQWSDTWYSLDADVKEWVIEELRAIGIPPIDVKPSMTRWTLR